MNGRFLKANGRAPRVTIRRLSCDNESMKKLFLNSYFKLILFWIPIACLFITITTTETSFWFVEFSYAYLIAVVTASFVQAFYWYLKLDQYRLILQLLLQFALAVPGIFLGYHFAYFIFQFLELKHYPSETPSNGVAFFYMGFVFVLVAIYEQHQKALRLKHEAEIKTKELENLNLQVQLKTLNLQLSPHFLLNSLNTLIGVVPVNPSLAEHLILKMADLYRGIVVSSTESEHSLKDEYKICEAYLEIEKIRFGSRLHFEFSIDLKNSMDRYIVPVLMLQPLIENAVKFGVAPFVEGGHIHIRFLETQDTFEIQVTNSLSIADVSSGTQTGLLNLKKRIQLIYGDSSKVLTRFEKKQALVSIQIPKQMVLCEDFA